MKKAKKVTRIAYSDDLNQAKYDALNEITKRCGSIRTHGKNHTFNQMVLEPGSYRCFSHNGKNYIEVISLKRGKRIAIPVGTNYSITGQIRLILREGQVEIHYTIANTDERACGNKEIGIDKGYTEAFVDSEGD